MSEPPPSPSDPPEPDPTELGAEDDLDNLLAAAADLAQEISREITGPDDPPGLSRAEAEFLAADTPTDDGIDAQLAQLEALARTTQEEIGSPDPVSSTSISEDSDVRASDADASAHESVPSADATDDRSSGAPERPADLVPVSDADAADARHDEGDAGHGGTTPDDYSVVSGEADELFPDTPHVSLGDGDGDGNRDGGGGGGGDGDGDGDGDDLTSPPEGGILVDAFGAPPPRGGHIPALAPSPDVAAPLTAAVVGDVAEPDEPILTSTPAGGDPDADVGASGASSDGDASSTGDSSSPGDASSGGDASSPAGRLMALAAKAMLPVAGGAVGLLELADKPARHLSPRFKTTLGWVALATLGTAVWTLLWSMLR